MTVRKNSLGKIERGIINAIRSLDFGEEDKDGFLSGVGIVRDGIMRVYNGLGEVTKELSRSCEEFSGNKDTLVVTYDGGMFWDVMDGSYGWSLHDKFMEEVDKVLGEYGLYIEPINSWSFTLWDDGSETVKKYIS